MKKMDDTFLAHLPEDLLVPIETVEKYTGLPRKTISRFAHGKHATGKKLPYYNFGQRDLRFRVSDIKVFVEDLRR